jgi:hypothetical protein
VSAHVAVVVRSQEYLIIDLGLQQPVKGLGYGWECLTCDAAEAAHFATEAEARAAADWHQDPPVPGQAQRHEVAVTRASLNRVLLNGYAGLAGRAIASLGYGWECLTCHRAEAAHFPSAALAQEAGDRHAIARPADLMSVTDLLSKLDTVGDVIGVRDHDTQLVRAFVLKANPIVNGLVERLTLLRPPAPYEQRRR